ncbi:DUF2339 domain-containing protein [Mycolicibacter minnesotensis]
MTEPHAVINRLTKELQALSWQLYRVSDELADLDRLVGAHPAPAPVPAPGPTPSAAAVAAPAARPSPTRRPAPAATPQSAPSTRPEPAPRAAADTNWIGQLLAVVGVAVTLVGVVLLLVLAAQAGMLGPQIRVAGGIGLAAALVAVSGRLYHRPGGRVGAIALAATGIAAAYLDIVAITTVYTWVPAPVGLILATAVGGAGLTLARRWDSEYLGVLVLAPMIVLGPILTGGVDLLLIGFLLTLSAAVLPVQLGKDWTAMSAARIAVATVPLLVALVAISEGDNPALLGGVCAVAAALAILGGLLLIPTTTNHRYLALLSAAGTLPVLVAGIAVPRTLATVLAAALAVGLLAIVRIGNGLPRDVVRTWSALAAIATLIAVVTAFRGYLQAPVLLSIGVLLAVAGRRDPVARWAAAGFGSLGVLVSLGHVGPGTLLRATAVPLPPAMSTLIADVLMVALVAALARVIRGAVTGEDAVTLAVLGGGVVLYAVTSFTVTFGILVGGVGAGFVAGQTAATICWIALAAGMLGYALRLPEERRRPPILAGLLLTGAATAKLFLFDMATLSGMFRVSAFIVVGLILLAMGSGYARSLAAPRTPQGNR